MPPRKPRKPVKSSKYIDDEAEEDNDDIDEHSEDDQAKDIVADGDDPEESDLEIVSSPAVVNRRASKVKSPVKAKTHTIQTDEESDAEAAVKLAPGDSVYKGIPRKKTVSTPPLSTRSSTKVHAKRPARTEEVSDEDGLAANARASKKVKNTSVTLAETEPVDEPSAPRTPTRSVKKKTAIQPAFEISEDDKPIVALALKATKSRTAKAQNPIREPPVDGNSDDGTDFSDPPPPSAILEALDGKKKATDPKEKGKGKQVQAVSDDSDDEGETFGDTFPDEVVFDADVGVNFTDLMTAPVAILPSKCEVTNDSCDPDKFFVRSKDYVGLPNLRACVFLPWRANAVDPGKTLFSAWAKYMDNLPIKKPLLFIRFVRSGQYVNPSRISPVELRSYKTMSPKGDSRQLYVDSGRIAVCLSAVCATTSFLFTPQEKRGIIQRTLAGRLHTQEWERYCACIGMVFGHTKMNAQYDDGALSFTSKSDGPTPASASLPSDMFSPGKKARGGIKPVLNYDDEMIIYDIRQIKLKTFDFPSILENPVKLAALPRFREEVPVGSLVVVAHTVSAYVGGKGDVAKLNHNFQWAMLIGVPK